MNGARNSLDINTGFVPLCFFFLLWSVWTIQKGRRNQHKTTNKCYILCRMWKPAVCPRFSLEPFTYGPVLWIMEKVIFNIVFNIFYTIDWEASSSALCFILKQRSSCCPLGLSNDHAVTSRGRGWRWRRRPACVGLWLCPSVGDADRGDYLQPYR